MTTTTGTAGPGGSRPPTPEERPRPGPPRHRGRRWTGGRHPSADHQTPRQRKLRRVSFGGTSAVVTSIGLTVGFATATANRAALVGSLLIVGIADNITDSLSVHVYQESEGLEPGQAIRSTASNFATRLVVTATF